MTRSGAGEGQWDPEVEHAERQRLGMLDAVAAAIERRNDVLGACFAAAGHDEAVSVIAEMLRIPERHARAVIDLQFRRLTGEARRRIDMEREDIRSHLPN